MALVTHLAFELRTSTPDSLVAALAERVETSGYCSLWVNHPPNEDGLGQLAQMAAATTRITLGTAVIPIGAVAPDAILRRIDETGMLPERLRLGIGSGSGPQPRRSGRRPRRPAARCRASTSSSWPGWAPGCSNRGVTPWTRSCSSR